MNTDIPVIILCGGQGTRIRDVSEHIPKPMLPIGKYPMLWHIMSIYAHHGYKNFILALGHKSWAIKEYFLNFKAMTSNFSLHLGSQEEIKILSDHQPLGWNITFVETGEESETGRRVMLCEKYVQTDEFMVTYGDGVADIDIGALRKFHAQHGKLATVTGVRPPGRFGAMSIEGHAVLEFNEKMDAGGGLINGGFFVFQKLFFKILRHSGNTPMEMEPMNELVHNKQLQVFIHSGFWEPMDTLREYNKLNKLWSNEPAPWKVWD